MDFGASEQHYYILSDIINFSEYLTFLSSVEMWSHVARSNSCALRMRQTNSIQNLAVLRQPLTFEDFSKCV